MYYYNEEFYSEVRDIIEDWDFDQVGDSFVLMVENCSLEPIITLTADMIVAGLEYELEERHSELFAQEECDEIVKVLNENIDFDKLNSKMQKLWYPNGTFETYSKAQLLSLLEQPIK